MISAYLGLGSNIDPEENLKRGIELLKENSKIQIVSMSSIYKTEPIGYKDQDWFLNMVVKINTILSPDELLDYCNWVEKSLKRRRMIRWGPRTIDIDILLYDDLIINTPRLTIPHPRMRERAFVIIPMLEIEPDMKIGEMAIKEIAEELKDQKVYKFKDL